MKKVFSAFLLVLVTTALSLILADSIYAHTAANTMESFFIANIISIALAVAIYGNFFDSTVTIHHFHPVSPIDRPGMIKK